MDRFSCATTADLFDETARRQRKCGKCGTTKSIEDFPIEQGYRKYTCTPCWRLRNSTKSRAYYANNREATLVRCRASHVAAFQKVLNHYGTECACCGEVEPLFLTVDHMLNDGNKHRKEDPAGRTNIYRWLIRNGFPSGFQILCINCNQGRHRNGGMCPHKARRND